MAETMAAVAVMRTAKEGSRMEFMVSPFANLV
jgi:hypothetical protein